MLDAIKLNQIRLLILLTICSIALARCDEPVMAEEIYEQWKMERPGFVEPDMKYMVGWNVNEVPRNVTIYYDLDGDGVPELVFAHPIIAENANPKCDGGFREEENYHVLLSTCPSEMAVDYFFTKQYSMFRLLRQRVWSRVFRMVRNERI